MQFFLPVVFGCLCLASAVEAAAPVTIPPVTQPGVGRIEVLCTATDKGLSSDCRSAFPSAEDSHSPRVAAELAYLAAHPIPISGADVGAEVKMLVHLKVTSAPGGKTFAVAESEGLFLAASGPPIEDPVWAQPPYGPWAGLLTPERAYRLRVSGEVTARCVATPSGALVNCWIQKEAPPDQHFGEAFLRTLEFARLKPLTASGAPVEGRPIVVRMKYELGK